MKNPTGVSTATTRETGAGPATHERIAAIGEAMRVALAESCRGSPERVSDSRTIYAIPIDRCIQHGVWFDRDELERVLYATSDVTGRRIDE